MTCFDDFTLVNNIFQIKISKLFIHWKRRYVSTDYKYKKKCVLGICCLQKIKYIDVDLLHVLSMPLHCCIYADGECIQPIFFKTNMAYIDVILWFCHFYKWLQSSQNFTIFRVYGLISFYLICLLHGPVLKRSYYLSKEQLAVFNPINGKKKDKFCNLATLVNVYTDKVRRK